jgi:hypothetical protein
MTTSDLRSLLTRCPNLSEDEREGIVKEWERMEKIRDAAETVASWLTNDFSNRHINKQKRMGEFLWHVINKPDSISQEEPR